MLKAFIWQDIGSLNADGLVSMNKDAITLMNKDDPEAIDYATNVYGVMGGVMMFLKHNPETTQKLRGCLKGSDL